MASNADLIAITNEIFKLEQNMKCGFDADHKCKYKSMYETNFTMLQFANIPVTMMLNFQVISHAFWVMEIIHKTYNPFA